MIREAFEHFGVEGTIEGISPGPVITVYEFQPAPGVKVSRIVNLQDDLALALKAESVRIERLPGRSTLGIEVPNKTRSADPPRAPARPREASAARRRSLTMALGVDIYGRPYYADLATMPHLLVAGATGAGKSVGLQTHDHLDPLQGDARRRCSSSSSTPSASSSGSTPTSPTSRPRWWSNPKKAANALRWAVAEMERRYRLLAEVHVRSIDYYNRAIRDPKERQRLSLQRRRERARAPRTSSPCPTT